MTLNFIKENGTWYIDLPEYIASGGSKASLAMVAGADDLLDEISDNEINASIQLSDEYYTDELVRSFTLGYGYYYNVISSEYQTKKIWLCPVTKYVFGGKYPKSIKFRKV